MSDSETDFFLSDSEETIIFLKKQISKMQKSFCHQQNDIKKLSDKNYEMNEILYENQKKIDELRSNYEKLSVENSNILRQNKNLEEKLRESEEKNSKNSENWNQEYNHRAIEILKIVEPQMMSRIDKIVNSDRKRKKSKKNKDSTEISSFETSHAMVIYVSDSN